MNRELFINCPFSDDYKDFFHAISFTTVHCGFVPRCALEVSDASEVRLDKISAIIKQCRLGIHDISNTELDLISGLPRFNMPLELGLFFGAKKFGSIEQRKKKCMIFDRDANRYDLFISDISGQDIHTHGGNVDSPIGQIAAWLGDEFHDNRIPGGDYIVNEYKVFRNQLPDLCIALRKTPSELTFKGRRKIAEEWILRRSA
jgi:hypothetical protein